MSKQDRVFTRTPSDLERKYNLGEYFGNGEGSLAKLTEQINRLSQTTSQFMAKMNAEVEELQGKVEDNTNKISGIYPVGSFFTSVNNVNPSTMFDGTWELYTVGYIIMGQEVNEDVPPSLLQATTKCYVWKRTA